MIIINLIAIIILIGLNAFFVMFEFGLVASRRAKLEVIIEKESRITEIVREWLQTPSSRDRLIAANQLGITVVSLAIGAVGENTFDQILHPLFAGMQIPESYTILSSLIAGLPLILSLIIVTALHVIFGEQVPKVAVLRSPEQFLLNAAPTMRVFTAIFKHFISALDWASQQVLKLLGISADDAHSGSISLEEMKVMLSDPEIADVIEKPERDMLSAVIDFSQLIVRQVAIPRTEIIGIDAELNLADVLKAFTESNVTKLPVYEESLDQIIGIIHIRDIIGKEPDTHITARELKREALFVPETIAVNDLLLQFRSKRQHIAIVLDEYGGTAGLVTLEDLVEEIVGDYRDSFELSQPSIQVVSDGKALVDGLTLIDDINSHFGLHLYDPNYDTIAGYLLGRIERIPRQGDKVDDPEHGIQLVVESMDQLRISQVMIIKKPAANPEKAAE